jgi:hypothetical protein
MANEAVIIELFNGGRPIRFTCADNTGIEKGTMMELTDPRTVIANTNITEPVVGIAAAEKVANDGSTTIAVYTDGIFDMLSDSATQGIGIMVSNTDTENTIGTAVAAHLLDGSVIGKTLEEAGNAEVVAVRVNL